MEPYFTTKGGDTLKALSRALSNERHTRLAHVHNTHKSTGAADATIPTCTVDLSEPTTHQTTEDRLFTMCDMVNNRVHSVIDKHLQQDNAHATTGPIHH